MWISQIPTSTCVILLFDALFCETDENRLPRGSTVQMGEAVLLKLRGEESMEGRICFKWKGTQFPMCFLMFFFNSVSVFLALLCSLFFTGNFYKDSLIL